MSAGTLTLASRTHRGPRPMNQDSILILGPGDLSGHTIRAGIAVADGMGGHAGGEVASSIAITEFETALRAAETVEPIEFLRGIGSRIHHEIQVRAAKEPVYTGMGTTFTAVIATDSDWFLLHVGDSRAYLLRGQELSLLTQDHTELGEACANGADIEDARRNLSYPEALTRAMGVDREPEPQCLRWPRRAGGEVVFTCSDGVWKDLPNHALIDAFLGTRTLSQGVSEVLRRALQAGASDNVSVVALESGRIARQRRVGTAKGTLVSRLRSGGPREWALVATATVLGVLLLLLLQNVWPHGEPPGAQRSVSTPQVTSGSNAAAGTTIRVKLLPGCRARYRNQATPSDGGLFELIVDTKRSDAVALECETPGEEGTKR